MEVRIHTRLGCRARLRKRDCRDGSLGTEAAGSCRRVGAESHRTPSREGDKGSVEEAGMQRSSGLERLCDLKRAVAVRPDSQTFLRDGWTPVNHY